ncbi:septum formation initiator family protein [uncultured Jatrophihabitans sp.]|uniref:septum formation initiator family protein n=1 Tax=uncultured Jatrophihabitans sp. TaxID=1610747 RepID=UPI0035CC72D7
MRGVKGRSEQRGQRGGISSSGMGAGPRRSRPRHAGPGVGRLPFALLVLGLLVGGLALLLVLNTASAANELRRHTLAVQDVSVAAMVQQLANEVAASAAPGNLAAAAAQLGMVPAHDPAFLVLEPDGSVGLLGHPGPATAPPLAAPKKPKASPSTSAKPSPGAKSSAKPGAKSSVKPGAKSSVKSSPKPGASTSAKASPSRTTPPPTPTVTLPGGDR